MVYKYISSKAVIAKVYSNFGITHSGWEYDAIEWIGEALGIIGGGIATEQVVFERRSNNYRVKIPCSLDQILFIEHNGRRLPPLDGIRGIRNDTYDPSEMPTKWYYLNGGYIATSFNNELIYIHALTLPVDCDGFPYVPDAPEVTEACAWFILRNLLSRGYNHPVFKWGDAEINWEKWWVKAHNKIISPDLDRLQKIKEVWTQWCSDGRRMTRFMNPTNYGEQTNDYVRVIDPSVRIVRIEGSDDLDLATNL